MDGRKFSKTFTRVYRCSDQVQYIFLFFSNFKLNKNSTLSFKQFCVIIFHKLWPSVFVLHMYGFSITRAVALRNNGLQGTTPDQYQILLIPSLFIVFLIYFLTCASIPLLQNAINERASLAWLQIKQRFKDRYDHTCQTYSPKNETEFVSLNCLRCDDLCFQIRKKSTQSAR